MAASRAGSWSSPPPGRDRLILLVYGQHASLERIFGVAEYLSRYGRVVVPDLPGFGGMTPLPAIGRRPSLDNYAGYLGQFIDQEIKPGQAFSGGCLAGRLRQRPDLIG